MQKDENSEIDFLVCLEASHKRMYVCERTKETSPRRVISEKVIEKSEGEGFAKAILINTVRNNEPERKEPW